MRKKSELDGQGTDNCTIVQQMGYCMDRRFRKDVIQLSTEHSMRVKPWDRDASHHKTIGTVHSFKCSPEFRNEKLDQFSLL